MGAKDKQAKKEKRNFIRFCADLLSGGRMRGKKLKQANVYFISGMCYNCTVFDNLKLPGGYEKKYLEWYTPHPDEALPAYAVRMAAEIDRSKPFVLVGYSFGAVVMQEMNKFLKPEKSIIISSFKSADEVPALFKAVKKTRIAEKMSMKFYSSTEFITEAFNRLIYHSSNEELARFMTVTDPVYIKWAVVQITDWIPRNTSRGRLYHIHGTDDQIFPFDHLKEVFPVEGGDHLMVFKKADVVSPIIDAILLMRD